MALEDRATGNRERQLLTECPISWCNEDLSGKTKTSDHFYTDHLPEDFGLAPLGEIREGTAEPLFEDPTIEATETSRRKELLADGGGEEVSQR